MKRLFKLLRDEYSIDSEEVNGSDKVNEIKKDFEFLKMFGLLHRIAIPMYGRYYALDKDDNNKIKSSISLLYRIGTKATLKVLWS